MTEIKRKKLFNEAGDRDWQQRRLLNGNTTNMLEFNNVAYEWAEKLYMKMSRFFWVPEECPMLDDKKQFLLLTAGEQTAYKKILSFLIFLDSIQVANLGYIANYLHAPEIDACLKTQAFFETIHSQSYDYILTSVVDAVTRDQVYNEWRTDQRLLERNRFITNLYEDFISDPSQKNLLRSLMANFLLEGIYFYAGFAFFYALGRQNKMGGTVSVIRLIQRDELLHLALFTNIFRELRKEEPHLFTPELTEELVGMAKTAVEHEIAWGQYVIQNQIIGLSDEIIARYIKYLGNIRCAAIGLPKPYPEITEHPMKWVDEFANMNDVKTDFFERRVGNYQKAGGKLNFDKLRNRPIGEWGSPL